MGCSHLSSLQDPSIPLSDGDRCKLYGHVSGSGQEGDPVKGGRLCGRSGSQVGESYQQLSSCTTSRPIGPEAHNPAMMMANFVVPSKVIPVTELTHEACWL